MTAPVESLPSVGERRMPHLDGLRGLAALAVVAHHTIPVLKPLEFGTLGVNLFFVLSGFLISSILFDARTKSARLLGTRKQIVWAFYARRFLRIAPPYFLVLGVAIALGFPNTRETAPYTLTYTTNFLFCWRGEFSGPPVSHLWTLAVEEQFYLILPFVVLLCPYRVLPAAVGALVAAGPLCRVLIFTVTGSWESAALFPLSNFDTLGAGVLLALFRTHLPHIWTGLLRYRAVILSVGFMMLVTCYALQSLEAGWKVRVVLWSFSQAIIFVYLIDRAARGFTGVFGRIFSLRPIIYLGTISYGVYLYHEFVPLAVQYVERVCGVSFGLPPQGWRCFVVVSGLTLALASLSWALIERPLNGLKRCFPYTGTGESVGPERPEIVNDLRDDSRPLNEIRTGAGASR